MYMYYMYVTIVHILVFQSDSGFGSGNTSSPAHLETGVDECRRPVYVHVEPSKQHGDYHGNTLLLLNSLQGLISGFCLLVLKQYI